MSTTHFYADGGGNNQGGAVTINQVTELNVVAPKEVTIAIPPTEDYALPEVNVLKLIAGEESKVLSACGFDATDAGKFEANQFVAFDGTMKLKTSETVASVRDQSFTGGFLTVTKIDQSRYGEIKGIEVV